MSKKALVLSQLKTGSWLTQQYAEQAFGVLDLSKQISLLKKDKLKINRRRDPVSKLYMYQLEKQKYKPVATQTDFPVVHVPAASKQHKNTQVVLDALKTGKVLSAANCQSILGMNVDAFNRTIKKIKKNHTVGSRPLTGAVDKRCREYFIDKKSKLSEGKRQTHKISPQAQAILDLIKNGQPLGVVDISDRLNIPVNGVRTCLYILRKHYTVSKKKEYGFHTQYYIET